MAGDESILFMLHYVVIISHILVNSGVTIVQKKGRLLITQTSWAEAESRRAPHNSDQ